MSVLTISAVNAATDQLTITAHGLTTGAPFCEVYTHNGVIPGGLAAATDYFVIVDDANTIRLATSSANALAGTAIDITTTGSGTLELRRGVPYSRNTTYAASSQVKSADLDAMQDGQQKLWRGARAAIPRHIPASIGRQTDGGAAMSIDGTADFVLTAANGNKWRFPIVVAEGERLGKVQCRVACGAAPSLTMRVWKTDFGTSPATVTQLGTDQSNVGAAGNYETLTQAGLTEIVAAGGFVEYWAEITAAFAGEKIGLLVVTPDVP